MIYIFNIIILLLFLELNLLLYILLYMLFTESLVNAALLIIKQLFLAPSLSLCLSAFLAFISFNKSLAHSTLLPLLLYFCLPLAHSTLLPLPFLLLSCYHFAANKRCNLTWLRIVRVATFDVLFSLAKLYLKMLHLQLHLLLPLLLLLLLLLLLKLADKMAIANI